MDFLTIITIKKIINLKIRMTMEIKKKILKIISIKIKIHLQIKYLTIINKFKKIYIQKNGILFQEK